MEVVNLSETFSRFTDHWSPKIVGDVNDMHVKLVKLSGEFVWHHHEGEDELFLVVEGRLRMQLRSGDRDVGPGARQPTGICESGRWWRAAGDNRMTNRIRERGRTIHSTT